MGLINFFDLYQCLFFVLLFLFMIFILFKWYSVFLLILSLHRKFCYPLSFHRIEHLGVFVMIVVNWYAVVQCILYEKQGRTQKGFLWKWFENALNSLLVYWCKNMDDVTFTKKKCGEIFIEFEKGERTKYLCLLKNWN